MSKTIIAFDVSEEKHIDDLLNTFKEPVYVKIGMESYYKFGNELINRIKSKNHQIFLDLKCHDIPNTVYHAMKNLASLDVDMLNVHASGGVEMMKAAVKGVKEVNSDIKCIAVTILTSLNEEMVSDELASRLSLEDTALHYAKNAKLAGMDGVVCSVHEVEKIHAICGDDFLCVTPGISLPTTAKNDQKRVATPEYAKQQGSNYIVVGRAITQSDDPYTTYLSIEGVMSDEN